MFQIVRMFCACGRVTGLVKENGLAFGAAPISLGINLGVMRNWLRMANYALQNTPQTAVIRETSPLVTMTVFTSMFVAIFGLFRFNLNRWTAKL